MAAAGRRAASRGAPQAVAAAAQRMGRRRLPPANKLWRMAAWRVAGRVSAGGTRRSSSASIQRAPLVR